MQHISWEGVMIAPKNLYHIPWLPHRWSLGSLGSRRSETLCRHSYRRHTGSSQSRSGARSADWSQARPHSRNNLTRHTLIFRLHNICEYMGGNASFTRLDKIGPVIMYIQDKVTGYFTLHLRMHRTKRQDISVKYAYYAHTVIGSMQSC